MNGAWNIWASWQDESFMSTAYNHCYCNRCFALQVFIRISFALVKQNDVTLPDQPNVIQNSYSPTPETCTVENINNDKEWVQDYIVIRGGKFGAF